RGFRLGEPALAVVQLLGPGCEASLRFCSLVRAVLELALPRRELLRSAVERAFPLGKLALAGVELPGSSGESRLGLAELLFAGHQLFGFGGELVVPVGQSGP